MQLNKVLKGLMIALPVMAVTACSSTDEATSATSGTESNQTTSAITFSPNISQKESRGF